MYHGIVKLLGANNNQIPDCPYDLNHNSGQQANCYLGVNIYTKMEQSGFNYVSSADYPRKLDTKQVVVGKNLTTELEMNNITTIEDIFASTYRFLTSYTNLEVSWALSFF